MTDPRLALTIPIEEIEPEAWSQVMNCLNIDVLTKLAIMPDVHCGYDLPIGGVALIYEHVWPAGVGFDIDCGMLHIYTGHTLKELKLTDIGNREKLYKRILENIPAGKGIEHKQPQEYDSKFPNNSGDKELNKRVQSKANKQIGTLGSGNHFIQIGVNDKDQVGITIHSGSRKPGYCIAEYYMKLAKRVGSKFGKSVSMFHIDSENGKNYMNDALWASQYAYDNRAEMGKRILKEMKLTEKDIISAFNETHNHFVFDKLNKKEVLHRKGATPAEEGQFGVIPANQRDGVYCTVGLGNEDFLRSASHGAGRKMSRKKASNNISLEKLQTQMKGIVCRSDKDILEEGPDAYKDIKNVIK